MIALSGATVNLTGNAEIAGDVVAFDQTHLSLVGNAEIKGTAHVLDPAAAKTTGNAKVGKISTELPFTEQSFLDSTNALAALTPTQVMNSVVSENGKTIQILGNGGRNVISIKGSILLSGNSHLVLKGTASDSFILNVEGDVNLHGNSSLSLEGGILAKNVVTHLTKAKSSFDMAGNSSVTGSILATSGSISIEGNGEIAGLLVAKQGISVKGNGLEITPAQFCTPPATERMSSGFMNHL